MSRNLPSKTLAFLLETERALNAAMSVLASTRYTEADLAWFRAPIGGAK